MNDFNNLGAATLLAIAIVGCGSDGDGASGKQDREEVQSKVISRYVEQAGNQYAAAVTAAEELRDAIDGLVESPSEATLEAARNKWLDAREPYGLTEVYRFYDGPIDDPDDGPEGQINAWPLDEMYIDYGKDDETAGLINSDEELTTELLVDSNEKGGEKNIATGYHAIEFLLWGQDLSDTGPGDRKYTDYVTDGSGAVNADRRGQYLQLVADLLIEDLTFVRDAWQADDGYGAEFAELEPKEALRRMLLGMGSLSGAELSGERMQTAFDNKDQEDEHSCFSDNTHRDLILNAEGIRQIYTGVYAKSMGAGISDWVKLDDAELDEKVVADLDATKAALAAIPVPFDQALQGEDTDEGREAIAAAITDLQTEADAFVDVAALYDITINLE
jgi:putative iron-regulated protein